MGARMKRVLLASVAMLTVLVGCAAPQTLPPEELARLKGGTTTVVVYGFCVPMDQLINVTITRHTMDFIVDGQKVGSMQTCSHATFSVKSGQWSTTFASTQPFAFPNTLPPQIYRPGTTQYLHMAPAGYHQFNPYWVSKAEADAGIAKIKKIGQMF